MDARIGRLIVEANEISQYLKKDYVFSTDKTGDSTSSTYVQVMSKSLKIDSKMSIPLFKDKLITLRKLMYKDPSDVNLSQADEVIGTVNSADIKSLHVNILEDKINESINESQTNINNCSSSPSTKSVPDNIPRRAVKTTRSEEKCGIKVDKNSHNSTGKLFSENKPQDASSNGKTLSSNFVDNVDKQDKQKPKELPRKRSLRKFQDIPDPTGSFNSKTSEPSLPVFQKRIEETVAIADRNSDSGLQMFLKVCGAATSAVEKNIQDNQYDSNLSARSLRSITELHEVITALKKSQSTKLTPDFELRCIQVITNLSLLSFTIPQLTSSSDVNDNVTSISADSELELMNSLKAVASSFTDLWKVVHNVAPAFEQQSEIHRLLLKLVQHLGSASITLGYPCPLSGKMPQEVRVGFLNGCDRAARLKMEASLIVVNQCYNLLESEHDESKDSDGSDKQEMRSSLLFKVFSLMRSIKQLLMIIKQIQEELKAVGTTGTTSDTLYLHCSNMLSASMQLSDQAEALTKSALLLTPAADVTILTLKRVSKHVAQVEEFSRCLSSSYIHGGMDNIMAQDQLEALSDVQSMIDNNCMDLKGLILDEISLGMTRSGNKTESSSNISLHSSFSMLSRTNSKRVLPATPRGDSSKQSLHHTPLVSENRVFKHINQSPMTSNTPRSVQDQKHFTLDHNDEVSAFERTDSRNYRALDEDISRSRLAMLEEEASRDQSGATTSNYAVFRRKPNTLRNQGFRHSFM